MRITKDTDIHKPLVIYHGGCYDGFCAAWLLHLVFPDGEFHPATHGNKPPEVDGRDVFVVDFSYDRSTMKEMSKRARSILVLDHHKSAFKELKNLEFCIFDMKRSGGRLTYDWLIENEFLKINKKWHFQEADGEILQVPWIVAYTEDRDLWLKKLNHSEAVNSALRSHPMDFAVWDALAKTHPSNLRLDGEAILRSNRIIIDNHVRHASIQKIGGYEVPVVNASCFISEIGNILSKNYPFAASYFDTPDSRVYSLRSQPNTIDVSEIAKKYGGGGHINAASFKIPLLLKSEGYYE